MIYPPFRNSFELDLRVYSKSDNVDFQMCVRLFNTTVSSDQLPISKAERQVISISAPYTEEKQVRQQE